jgi:hypothetical protein
MVEKPLVKATLANDFWMERRAQQTPLLHGDDAAIGY